MSSAVRSTLVPILVRVSSVAPPADSQAKSLLIAFKDVFKTPASSKAFPGLKNGSLSAMTFTTALTPAAATSNGDASLLVLPRLLILSSRVLSVSDMNKGAPIRGTADNR